MGATKTFVNYKSDLLSFGVANEQLLGILQPGRIRGFDTLYTPAPGLVFNLLHDATGIKKVRIDGSTESEDTGIVYTRQGVVAQFEASVNDLAVNENSSAQARVDVIYFQHAYQQTTASNLGSVGIEEGVPGAGEPALALPTQMVKIGTVTMPAGATQVEASFWQPSEPKGVGAADYAVVQTVINWLTSQDERRKNDLWPLYSTLTLYIPNIAFGTAGDDIQPSGLLLKQPAFNETVPSATVLGSFYMYLDGAIVLFEGGTFDLEPDGDNDKMLWFQRGTNTIQGNAELPYDVVYGAAVYVGDMPNTGASVGAFIKPAGWNDGSQGVGLMYNMISPSTSVVRSPINNNRGYTILGAFGTVELSEKVTALEEASTWGPWINLTLVNSASSLTGLQARKNGTFVELNGYVVAESPGGLSPITFTNLPEGYRPNRNLEIRNVARPVSVTDRPGQLEINTDGTMNIVGVGGQNTGTAVNQVDITNVRFSL